MIEELERLLERRDLRSADRANIKTMLKQARGGKGLDYQQRQNAWAYINRYRLQGGELDAARSKR